MSFSKQEEIRDIERKSSLLKSAIDQTIKNIEEYKEEVGMASKKEIYIEKSSNSESISFSSKTIEQVSNGVEKLDLVTENKQNVENSDIKLITNGLDSIQQESKPSDKIAKEVNNNLVNGDVTDKVLNDVEKHVEDIKKIVKNTDNIANITEINKTEVQNETIKNDDNELKEVTQLDDSKDIINENKTAKNNNISEIKTEIESESTKIYNKELGQVIESDLKKDNVNIKSEINTTDIVEDVIKKSDSVEISKDITVTQEPGNEKREIEEETKKLEENIKESTSIEAVNENKVETSDVDLEVRETLKEAESKIDPLLIVKPVEFHPENIRSSVSPRNVPVLVRYFFLVNEQNS